jgi:uncharacterized protein YqeY
LAGNNLNRWQLCSDSDISTLFSLGNKMTSLIKSIADTQLKLRKTPGSNVAVGVLTTLLGEAYAIGKNNGNRETTDAEVIALLKKFISNIDLTLDIILPKIEDLTVKTQADNLQIEKSWLETFLPRQMTNEELVKAIGSFIVSSPAPANMGSVMALLKANYAGLYDGKQASTIIKNLLAG